MSLRATEILIQKVLTIKMEIFVNVNEVHNNTDSMMLTGFNQEGGRVTGNIEKLVVESKRRI